MSTSTYVYHTPYGMEIEGRTYTALCKSGSSRCRGLLSQRSEALVFSDVIIAKKVQTEGSLIFWSAKVVKISHRFCPQTGPVVDESKTFWGRRAATQGAQREHGVIKSLSV